MKSGALRLIRILGRTALASACAIFILKAASHHSPRLAPYAFESTAIGSAALTRWPACATVEYSIDLRNAPRNAVAVVARDTRIVQRATGLKFRRIAAGAPVNFRTYDATGQVATVIFAWVGASKLLGQMNVNAVTVPIVDPTRTRYVSGVVLFNNDMNSAFQTDPTFANNLVLHELGHVLGLADVDNATEIMNYYLQPDTSVGSYASGDKAGLRKLYPPDCRTVSVPR